MSNVVLSKEGIPETHNQTEDDGEDSDNIDNHLDDEDENGEEHVIHSNLSNTNKGDTDSNSNSTDDAHTNSDKEPPNKQPLANPEQKDEEERPIRNRSGNANVDQIQPANAANPAANNANQNGTSSVSSMAKIAVVIIGILWMVFRRPPPPETPICSRIPDKSTKYKLQCPKCDAFDITGKCIIYAPLSAQQFTIDAKGEDGSLNDYPCTQFAWNLDDDYVLSSGETSPSLSMLFGDEAGREEIELTISIEIRDEHSGQMVWYQGQTCNLDVVIYEAPYFGIDLGTSYSCIAYQPPLINASTSKRETNIVIMDHSKMEYCIPSSVYFDGTQQQIYIGHRAKEMAVANDNDFDNYIYDIKRIIGRPSDDPSLIVFNATHTFELDLESAQYPSIKISNWNASGDAMKVTPDQIQAILLRELVRVASNEFGVPSLKDVVVSIPAIFHDAQRKAVHTACSIAGLNAKLLMVEPSAASIAHIYYTKQQSEKLHDFSKYFMTLDIGGGTTDVSMLRCTGLHCEVLGVAGNSSLGGIDFDAVVVEIMKSKLAQKGITEINEQLDDEMRSKAESVKKALSSNDEYSVRLKKDERANDYVEIFVTRKEFEEHPATQALVESMIALAKQAMFDDSNSNKKGREHLTNIKAILLIGGTVKIPYIQKTLKARFSGERGGGISRSPELIYPDDDPQLMVVKGSAIIGATMAYSEPSNADIVHHQILGGAASASAVNVRVDDVLPMSFGFDVCVMDYEQEDGHRCGVMDILIHKNSKYPSKGSGVYCQKVATASTATLMLYEGDHEQVAHNFFLTKLEINEVPPRNDYECNNIVVELEIDENGIANITARTNDQLNESNNKVYSKQLPVKSNDAHLSAQEIQLLHSQIVEWLQ